MGYNKIVYGGKTLIDLTGDTITADRLLKGVTAHGPNGDPMSGTCTYDSDTQDATAVVAEVLNGKTFYARGAEMTGTMPDNGAVTGVISARDGEYAVPIGFHDGGGKVSIEQAERDKLIPDNIREGVTVLGVVGTMSGSEDVKAQSKTVTPTTAEQTILPDAGYNYMTQVTVLAIPYVESANSAGGTTVTIG